MLLRIYSLLLVCTLTALVGAFVWLLHLPTQAGFVYDVSDARYVLLEYIDFVFLAITTLTIVLIIGRSSYHTALEKKTLSPFDRRLYKTMFNLPLILICSQCAFVILAILVATVSTGTGYF